MSEFGLYQVRPSTLRFTHDSVSCKFSNGLSLEETFRQFLYDELDVDDMQCLVAMYYNGKWLVVRGNRRLYLYKKLEKIGKFTTVEVDKQRFEQNLFERQYTSKNMGVSIRIRGFPNIVNVLNQITNECRNTPGFQIGATSFRRPKHRSKSRPRSGNTNAVAGYSGQSNTACTGSHTSGENSNHDYRQTYRPLTPPANHNYSWTSKTNSQPSTTLLTQNRALTSHTYVHVPPPRSYEYITPTPSVNHNSYRMPQTHDRQPRSTYGTLTPPEPQETTTKDNNFGCCTIL